ncbi:MAG: UbiA prenyltransferase family protein [Thermoanaerobaculia bacterium]
MVSAEEVRRGAVGRSAALLRAVRPAQWTKNLFVLAPLLFGKAATETGPALRTVAAAVSFCGIASALYLLNDVRDREADRAHPVKRSRPIAAGGLSPTAALAASAVLGILSFALVAFASPAAAAWAAVYAGLIVLYTFGLKSVALFDVFVVAAGFVLRVLAGSAAAGVLASQWLLLCTFFLALFLALSKRRGELTEYGAAGRESLRGVPVSLFESLENVTLGMTIVCYSLYTVSPETVAWFRTNRLLVSVPVVVFGMFRWRLLETQGKGEDTTKSLLTDPGLLATIAVWAALCAAVIYFPGPPLR